jgi:hypothetical protein
VAGRKSSITAQVILRSSTGRSLRDLGDGPPPPDLSKHLASAEVRNQVVAAFSARGFRAFADDLGLAVSIAGSPALFRKVFGIDRARLGRASAANTVSLPIPADLRSRVEEIVLLPAPELFR